MLHVMLQRVCPPFLTQLHAILRAMLHRVSGPLVIRVKADR